MRGPRSPLQVLAYPLRHPTSKPSPVLPRLKPAGVGLRTHDAQLDEDFWHVRKIETAACFALRFGWSESLSGLASCQPAPNKAPPVTAVSTATLTMREGRGRIEPGHAVSTRHPGIVLIDA